MIWKQMMHIVISISIHVIAQKQQQQMKDMAKLYKLIQFLLKSFINKLGNHSSQLHTHLHLCNSLIAIHELTGQVILPVFVALSHLGLQHDELQHVFEHSPLIHLLRNIALQNTQWQHDHIWVDYIKKRQLYSHSLTKEIIAVFL